MTRLGNKLIKNVFITFFCFTFVLTALHLLLSYTAEQDRFRKLLESYEDTVITSLSTGVWNFDPESLQSTLEGIVKAKEIYGAKVYTADSNEQLAEFWAEQKLKKSELLIYRFPIHHTDLQGEVKLVGQAEFYYSDGQVFSNLWNQFVLILILSLVKTALLWSIILFWSDRVISRPVKQLTERCRNYMSSQEPFNAELQTQDEMQELETSFCELIRHRDELAYASNQKSAFLSNMSHEFRTPLNAIIGYSEILLEELQGKQSSYNDLAKIHKSGTHMLSLVNDILDLANIQSGRLQLAKSTINVRELVRSLEDQFKPIASQSNNRLSIEWNGLAGDIPLVGDYKRIYQILASVLDNALKFTKDGSVLLEVELLESDQPEYIFTVSDSGIGIASSDLDSIFDKFSQTPNPSQSRQVGVGLGLSISKALIVRMNGDISIKSETSMGTTVRLSFPQKLQYTASHEVINPPSPKVLAVDDDPDILEFIQEVLGPYCELETCSDGTKVSGLVSAKQYDYLLLDIHMPSIDGLSLYRSLEDHAYQVPKTYFLTGTTVEAYLMKVNNNPHVGLITKPFDRNDLLSLLGYEEKKAS